MNQVIKIVVLLNMIVLLNVSCIKRFSCEKYRTDLKTIEYRGIVTKINLDTLDLYGKVIYKFKNKEDTLNLCRSLIFNNFWENIEIGDSLLKPLGSDTIFLFKSNNSVKKFITPCCDW